MRAIILAGGKGTRLKPYTTLIPKPLVPLGNRYSILEIILIQLRNAGFTHVTLAVNHFSRLIMAYFGDGTQFGLKIDYSLEDSELSTIGPLTLINDLPENFLVMNGDILSDINYYQLFQEHTLHNNLVTVSAFKRRVNIDFGVLEHSDTGLLVDFQEKPQYVYSVSMGIYCLNRSIISDLPHRQRYGFDNLMNDSLKLGRRINVYSFGGFWLDIGRPDDYEYANHNFDEIASRLKIN